MSVVSHGVSVEEEVTAVFFVVEVEGEVAHHAVQVVAFADDVISEVGFGIKLALVSLVEGIDVVVAPQGEIIVKGFLVGIAEVGIFNDFVEDLFTHAALAVELAGEILVVLEHQFRIIFVCMQLAADVNELIVVAELRKVKPKTVKRPAVVLMIASAVNRRVTVVHVGTVVPFDFVEGEHLLHFLYLYL